MGLNLMLEQDVRTAMSLEGILASCMKAEKLPAKVKENIRERGPDRERVMKMECEV